MTTATQQRFRDWFVFKRQEMLAQSGLAHGHSGLVGHHREEVIKGFLQPFLPQRLSVGRGIIYNPIEKTGECDAVIWDSANFPVLSMFDHSAFLMESVATVVEIKTRFSASELQACCDRKSRIDSMSISAGHGDLSQNTHHQMDYLNMRVASLEEGRVLRGMTSVARRTPYVAVFIDGGESLNLAKVTNGVDDLGSGFPDVLCFLRSGRLFRKWEGQFHRSVHGPGHDDRCC